MSPAEIVITCRKSAGLSQRSLAATLDVTVSTVSRWETGVSVPSLEVLERVAQVFGHTIELVVKAVVPVNAVSAAKVKAWQAKVKTGSTLRDGPVVPETPHEPEPEPVAPATPVVPVVEAPAVPEAPATFPAPAEPVVVVVPAVFDPGPDL